MIHCTIPPGSLWKVQENFSDRDWTLSHGHAIPPRLRGKSHPVAVWSDTTVKIAEDFLAVKDVFYQGGEILLVGETVRSLTDEGKYPFVSVVLPRQSYIVCSLFHESAGLLTRIT